MDRPFCDSLSHNVAFKCLMFMPEISSRMVIINGKHPRSRARSYLDPLQRHLYLNQYQEPCQYKMAIGGCVSSPVHPDIQQWQQHLPNIYMVYLFLSSWAGGIQQILQSDWFLERAELSHPDRHSGRNPSSWSIFVNEISGNRKSFALFALPWTINASLSLFTVRRKKSHLA